MHGGGPAGRWGYLFFLGLVIGLLSKGPLALVVCGLPIFAWVAWQKAWVELWRRIPWICGTLLMLAPPLPWYIAAEQATPGFLRYFIIGEHFERFLVKGWAGASYGKGHSRAIGTIWLYAAEMFLPWVMLVPYSAGKAQILTGEPESLRHGDYMAVHRSNYRIITHPDAWQLVAEDGSWSLYRKR